MKIENAYVSPLANGQSSIKVTYGKLSKSIPLQVSSTDKNDPVSFNWETLAILTKQGCNGGGCHGKPNGRGALELSLNAFDPDFDETNLIRGAMGRFLQPISPTSHQSVLQNKDPAESRGTTRVLERFCSYLGSWSLDPRAPGQANHIFAFQAPGNARYCVTRCKRFGIIHRPFACFRKS